MEKSGENMRINSFFSKWNRNSVSSANLGNLINHCSINYDQLKDPVCYLCLTGAEVASWSLTQEVAGSNPFDENYF